MLDSLAVLLPFYVIIGVGVIASAVPTLARGVASINDFVFYVALPAFLFVTVSGSDLSEGIPWPFIVAIALVTGGVGLIWGFLSRLVPGVRGFSPTSVGLASSYGNVSYFGVPIVLVIVGPDAALAAGVGQLVHNVLFLTGYPLMRAFAHRGHGTDTRQVVWLALRRGLLLNPLVISVAAGLACAAFLPGAEGPVIASIALIGQAAVPCALFAIGVALSRATSRLRAERGAILAIVYASFSKVIVLPVASFAAAAALLGVLSDDWIMTLVLLAAMPVSASAFVLAEHHEGDAIVVTGSIALTSAIALVTVPAFALMLQALVRG